MKRQTVTLLPFAPLQHSNSPPPPWSSQNSVVSSRLPSLIDTSVPCIMSSTSPKQLFVLSRRPIPLRLRPSIISEASCDTTTSTSSSSSSSSASSSSSFQSASSPTSLSTPSTSLPPSPVPPPPYVLITPLRHFRQSDCNACGCDALIAIASHARFSLFSPSNQSPGKSRPLPQPPALTERPLVPYNATDATEPRPRTPPPAWSPPGTPSPSSRPMRPGLVLPVSPTPRESPASPEVRMTPGSPSRRRTVLDGSISSPGQHRVRPLPMRPVPPGPPSEDNTPIAPFGLPRWEADTLTIPPDEILSTYDDRRAIDWDLIDEVMTHAS